jgi:hypothetical protein
MQTLSAKPAFRHDCNACRYLASLHDTREGTRDLYACRDSIVIRTGHDGPDYASLPRAVALQLGGDYARAVALETILA